MSLFLGMRPRQNVKIKSKKIKSKKIKSKKIKKNQIKKDQKRSKNLIIEFYGPQTSRNPNFSLAGVQTLVWQKSKLGAFCCLT